jgi:transcriptional regulator with XRE-family HTH domain
MTRFRTLREQTGLSQKQAAALLGTDPGNLSRVEQGKQEVSIQLLKRMREIYRASFDELIGDQGRAA